MSLTFQSAYIVFVGKKAGEVPHVKGNHLRVIKRLKRFHKIVGHLLRTVTGHFFKRFCACTGYAIILGLSVVVGRITPGSYLGCLVLSVKAFFAIEQPERNVYSFYLIDVILFKEDRRNEPFGFDIVSIYLNSIFFGLLKRDDIIRFELACKFLFYYNVVIAERAFGRAK